MRRPIGQTLADNATQDRVGALFVSVGLGGIAEVEFGQVAVHVGLAHMMIGADHAALQDREEVFSGVGMRLTLAELAASVERVTVAGELAVNGPVVASFVSHERRGAVHVERKSTSLNSSH